MNETERSEGAVERAVGRGALRGTLIGVVLMTAIVASMMVYAGAGGGAALAVGVFAAFWGGPGFGGMLGAVLALSRAERGLELSDGGIGQDDLLVTSASPDPDSRRAAA